MTRRATVIRGTAIGLAMFGAATGALADDFNPMQAVRDGATYEALKPVLEAEYGGAFDARYLDEEGYPGPSEGPAMLLVIQGANRSIPRLLFCDGKLAGFAVPLSQPMDFHVATMALEGLEGHTPRPSFATEDATAMIRLNTVTVTLPDGLTRLSYSRVGSAEGTVLTSHPYEVMRDVRKMYTYCTNGSDE